MDEATLVKRARQGDQEALARLLQGNYRTLLGYLIKATLDRPTAEDLAQDTMVRAIEKIGSFNGRSRFSSWLITIATNLYRDRLRRRRLEDAHQLEVDEKVEYGGFESYTVDKADVASALEALSPEKRAALVLRYFYDFTYDEVAEAMGVPVGTIRSRLHNAAKQLKSLLASGLTAILGIGGVWG